jgi:hypothetical protein
LSESSLFGSGTENVVIKAVFALMFKLNLTTSGTGTGSFECDTGSGAEPCQTEYAEGTNVEVIPVEASGSEFVEWTGDCSGSGACSVTMSAEHSVNGVFNTIPPPSEFELSVTKSGTGSGTVTSSPPGINCGATCAAEFPENEVVTLNQSAAAGSEFAGWSGACSGAGACEVTMSEAKSVDAKFEPEPVVTEFELSVTKAGSGSGTVTSSPPGINCGATCSAEFPENEVVTLNQSAAAGSEFAGWSGACSGTGSCVVTMSEAKEVTATFTAPVPVTHTLTITKAGSGSGTVTCDGGACASSYPQGTTLTLAATAASGSSFAGWSGGGCSGTGGCVVTINTDTTVTATFNANPPPIEEQCVVPKLKGKTLSKAKSALTRAHCKLGKVAKPKTKKGPLVIKSSKPGAGTTLPAGSKVNLKLAPKPKKR